MTYAQRQRQDARGRNGRYNVLNPCERCGRSAGANFFSDDRCNVFEGAGQFLCRQCHVALKTVPDDRYLAELGICKHPVTGQPLSHDQYEAIGFQENAAEYAEAAREAADAMRAEGEDGSSTHAFVAAEFYKQARLRLGMEE